MENIGIEIKKKGSRNLQCAYKQFSVEIVDKKMHKKSKKISNKFQNGFPQALFAIKYIERDWKAVIDFEAKKLSST